MPTGKIGQLGATPGNIELGFAPTVSFATAILASGALADIAMPVARPIRTLFAASATYSSRFVSTRVFAASVVGVAAMLDALSLATTINHALFKNFGPATSGYLDATSRNFETVVYESGKPILDRELNLAQDIDGGTGQLAFTTAMSSGWISDDFTGTSDPTVGIFAVEGHSNYVRMPQNLIAHVNGWMLIVSNTTVSDHNLIILPAPPSGVGTTRTDLIILEVWRKLLSPAPSTDGKSASGRIWQNGNVKTDPVNDTSLNFADDIEGSDVGTETTKRVQIQFRLRAITGVDILSYPYGLDDPTVRANSVPPNASTPDGNSTSFVYETGVFATKPADAGLWVAGDGDPANSLGTVDGYMYAIPLMGVFRRNSSGFDRVNNQNGAQLSPSASDRPDGLLADITATRDIIDLRFGVSPVGWNYAEVLDKNFTYLLDNALYTERIATNNAGSQLGHTFLWNDQIGVSTVNGGSAPNSGDGPSGTGGPLVGQFDAVRRAFSDRATYEMMTVAVPAPGGGWPSSTSTINFASLPVYPYTSFNWAAYVPTGTMAIDVVAAHFIGTSGNKSFDGLSHITSVTNLCANPIGSLTITFDALTGLGLTTETLYLDILIAYPGGGLTYTATNTYGASSFSINNPSQLPATSPVSYSTLSNLSIDPVHREAYLQYTTEQIVLTIAADTTITGDSSFRLPERAAAILAVNKNGSPIVGMVTLSTGQRTATFTNPTDYTSPGDTLQVTYEALRPLPQNNEQISVWYEARAPQTGRDSIVQSSISVIPRFISPHLYSLTTGSGSQDTGYPFPYAYVQTGGIYPSSAGSYTGERSLFSRASISVANLSASTGFLKLPVLVPYVPDPEAVTFNRALSADTDIEGRTFFKSVPAGYLPNAYAQDLSDPKRHKVILPVLAELPAASTYGHKGQLVLLLLIRWATLDEVNAVYFNADLTQDTTVASIFHIKGHLLNRRNV